MMEVELKAALRPEQVRLLSQMLLARGFEEQAAVLETDVYFNASDRDFARTDEALRLRKVCTLTNGAEQTCITYKGAKVDARSSTRRELETMVGSFETMRALLLALGYRAVYTVQKTRRSFACGSRTVCLYNVEGLGDYIELETVLPDDADSEAEVTSLLTLLDAFSVPRDALRRESYLDLLLESASAQKAYL